MIVNILITIFVGMMTGLINLLPAYPGMPTPVHNAITTVTGWLVGLNDMFPMDTLYAILALTIAFELGIMTYKLVNWTINKTRGSG